jgi:hypothetical protein
MVRASNKKIWKDRQGIGGITAILAVILVIALAAVAYMAIAQASASDGKDQDDKDNDGDGVADPIIGFIQVAVEIKTVVPAFEQAEFSINDIDVTLVDEQASMSIIDSLFMGGGDKNLKLVCTLEFPIYDQVLINGADRQWEQHFFANDEYTVETFNSGGVRYHGVYTVDLTLYKFQDDKWVEVQSDSMTVNL